MGTQSSRAGPKDRNPLLPSWAQPEVALPLPVAPQEPQASDPSEALPPNTERPQQEPERGPVARPWQRVKATTSRLAAGGGGGGGVRRLGRRYVEARGGSRRAAANSVAGRRATASLGRFVGAVARGGLAEAAAEFGLAGLAEATRSQGLAMIAAAIAPRGAEMEEAAARKAQLRTLEELWRQHVTGNTMASLDQWSAAEARAAIEAMVRNYVYERWLGALEERIESRAMTAAAALTLERQMEDYVRRAVGYDLRDVDPTKMDWEGPQGQALMERIYQEAYAILEAAT